LQQQQQQPAVSRPWVVIIIAIIVVSCSDCGGGRSSARWLARWPAWCYMRRRRTVLLCSRSTGDDNACTVTRDAQAVDCAAARPPSHWRRPSDPPPTFRNAGPSAVPVQGRHTCRRVLTLTLPAMFVFVFFLA